MDYVEEYSSNEYTPDWFAGWRLPGEYISDSWKARYQRELRKSLNTYDPDLRPLLGYVQLATRPGLEWSYSQYAGWSPEHPSQPDLGHDEWNDVAGVTDPVSYDAKSNAHKTFSGTTVRDYYGAGSGTWTTFEFMQMASGAPMPVWDETLQGAYIHFGLATLCGDLEDEIRIWPYHETRLIGEGINNLTDLLLENQFGCEEHRAFYMPELLRDANTNITPSQARHDFWLGVHQAWGIWIYNMAWARSSGSTVWAVYREGLRLLKDGGLRDEILGGRMVVVPKLGAPSGGGPYTTQTTTKGNEHLIACSAAALPLGHTFAQPAYTGVQATLTLEGTVGHLIITNSIGLSELGLDPVEYEVELEGAVSTIELVIGSAGPGCGLVPSNVICDSFEDIDARVYEITWSSPPDWPPLPAGWIAERFNERESLVPR
jgi:hypothetical protein